MESNRPKRDDSEEEDVGSTSSGARAPSALPAEVRPSGVYPRDVGVTMGETPKPPLLPAAAAARHPKRPCTSFEDVYDRHLRLVWWRLHKAGVVESERDDLVQEVFLVMNAHLHEKGMPGDVPRVLLAITENQIRNYRRGRRRFLAKVDPEAEAEGVAVPSSRSSPERILARAEVRRMVTTTLEKMPERAAEVLRLTDMDMDELSQREIAARMSCPEGTLRSRHHRARDYFRALVARLYRKDSR